MKCMQIAVVTGWVCMISALTGWAAPIQPGQTMDFNEADVVFTNSTTFAAFNWSVDGSDDNSWIKNQQLAVDTGTALLTAPLGGSAQDPGLDLTAGSINITMDMTFSIPTSQPTVAEFLADGARFGMIPGTNGFLLVTDRVEGQPVLIETPILVTESTVYPVVVTSAFDSDQGILFTLKIGTSNPVSVRSLNADSTLSTIASVSFKGEGGVDNLSVASASVLPEWITGDIPQGADTTELTAKYGTWLADVANGTPDADGADAAAFLLNTAVGTDPMLSIASISVAERVTITVQASYVRENNDVVVDMSDINGILTVYLADTLTETFTPYTVLNFTTGADGLAVIEIPTPLGNFIKATVEYVAPEGAQDLSEME